MLPTTTIHIKILHVYGREQDKQRVLPRSHHTRKSNIIFIVSTGNDSDNDDDDKKETKTKLNANSIYFYESTHLNGVSAV